MWRSMMTATVVAACALNVASGVVAASQQGHVVHLRVHREAPAEIAEVVDADALEIADSEGSNEEEEEDNDDDDSEDGAGAVSFGSNGEVHVTQKDGQPDLVVAPGVPVVIYNIDMDVDVDVDVDVDIERGDSSGESYEPDEELGED